MADTNPDILLYETITTNSMFRLPRLPRLLSFLNNPFDTFILLVFAGAYITLGVFALKVKADPVFKSDFYSAVVCILIGAIFPGIYALIGMIMNPCAYIYGLSIVWLITFIFFTAGLIILDFYDKEFKDSQKISLDVVIYTQTHKDQLQVIRAMSYIMLVIYCILIAMKLYHSF